MRTQRAWRDISYLQDGTERQRSAFANLQASGVLERLRSFDAVLVSTVCLDIDIESSDLDIICEVRDLELFATFLTSAFGSFWGFGVHRSASKEPAVVAQFFFGEWEYEVFGQRLPVARQNAFRHLIQIDRVLSCGGARWREAIRGLKRSGMKTEPAVAQAVGLSGDPYQAVLSLEALTDDELRARMRLGPCA
ncbi:MAG: hypothetical protein RIS36_365 [Pseudomonadota bacterium]